MSALLDIRGLVTRYGASQVLFGVDLEIGAGEVVTLLGRNGMGKTTTVRTILGLVPPAGGSIALRGTAIAGWPAHRIARAGIGLVPEGRQIFPNLTVTENLVATARPGDWTLARIHALFPVPRVQRLDARLQRVEVDAFGMLLVLPAHTARLRHTLADDVEHVATSVEHRLLRHVADAQPLSQLEQPVVGLFQSGNDLEQRGLARAVATDQSEPLAGLERERRAVEQRHVAVGEMGIGKRQDGHGSARNRMAPHTAF